MDFLLKKYRNALQESFRNKESLRQDKLREMELSLNNLNYHKQHLQVEIQKCTSYESIYQHLDVEPTSLEAELDMRTALSLQITEMKQQKIIKLKAIQDKQRELNELEAQLLVFIDSTKELQQRFGTDAAVLDQNYSKSQLLPKPLFVLYRHCLGYQQWTQNMLSVEIVDEPGQSLDYYSCHNLSVSIILMSNAKPLIKLRFCYLVQLETIIVKPELIEQFDNVPAALFSHNIFPGDDGKEACNTKLLFLDDGKFKFDYEFCQGYAYSWAQYVCGFYYPRSIDLKTNDSCTWILNDNGQPTVPFFSKVIELVTEKRAIAVQINSALASMTLKPQFAGLKSQKTPNCRISMFKRMETLQDSILFRAALVAKGRLFEFVIRLTASYPSTGGEIRITEKDAHIESLEEIVKQPVEWYLQYFNNASRNSLLQYQLTFLGFCLDAHVETGTLGEGILDVMSS